jgi:glycerol-3-phosphate acyltransferase PlsY
MDVADLPWLLGSYLLGAVPAAYLVARARGVDLGRVGSGNLGATNLYRALGWKAAVPAGLFDLFKGTAPVLLAQRLATGSEWFPLAVGIAAVLGHVFSPFVGFKGGKGVATAGGVFLALAPWALLAAVVVWAALVKLTGYVSLGSMVAAVAFAASLPLLEPGAPRSTIGAAVAVCGFILFTHRTNIRRLLAGTESRFGRRDQPAGATGRGGAAG